MKFLPMQAIALTIEGMKGAMQKATSSRPRLMPHSPRSART